jgi:hypothetical protein
MVSVIFPQILVCLLARKVEESLQEEKEEKSKRTVKFI